jgi:hypothetical protein
LQVPTFTQAQANYPEKFTEPYIGCLEGKDVQNSHSLILASFMKMCRIILLITMLVAQHHILKLLE